MSDRKLYAIDPDLVEPHWTLLGLARLLSDGALVEVVPDTRLQAIADAWNEEGEWSREIVRNEIPALGDLLDALQEDTE
jgi:hypothetical protein